MSSDDIGQLLVVRWPEPRWGAALERTLKRYEPAGVMLPLQRPESPESTAETLGRIKDAVSVPPLLWPDDIRIADRLTGMLPSPRAAAEAGPVVVEKLADLKGQGLRLLGFNSYVGPNLDLVPPNAGGIFTDRAFSSSAQTTTQYGTIFLQQLRRHGIAPCPGSFPGLGEASGARLDHLIVVQRPMASLWSEDLVPFREVLPRLRLIWISPGAYKAFDYEPLKPAPFSERILEGLLRVRLGYRGAAVAAPFAVGVGVQRLTVGQAAVRAINAGCDLLVANGDIELFQALAAVQEALETGLLSQERVEEALARVRSAKEGLALPSGNLSSTEWESFINGCEQFGGELQAPK